MSKSCEDCLFFSIVDIQCGICSAPIPEWLVLRYEDTASAVIIRPDYDMANDCEMYERMVASEAN